MVCAERLEQAIAAIAEQRAQTDIIETQRRANR